MKNIKRLAFVTVLSILPVSCSIMFVNPTATLADHKPMPKNVGLSATALPDLSKLKLDPQVMVVSMGVLMRHIWDQEGNLVSRVFSMSWEPEKNVVFEWRMAVPGKDDPANWEWKYFAAFEGSPPHETDDTFFISDPATNEKGLTTITLSIMMDKKTVATKTFVRPEPSDKK